MKRLLSVLALILLLAACNSESRNPVIKGYRLSQAGDLGFGLDGLKAALTLDLDVENPSRATYTLESLEAVLYRGLETEQFAVVSMAEPVSIGPRCETTIPVPLNARFTRPLALLGGGFSTDLADYTADLDLVLRKGSFKKRISMQRVPLDQIGSLTGQTTHTKNHEKE